MTQIDALDIPDELFAQIQGMAFEQARSINEQIVALLQQSLLAEVQRQEQIKVMQEIYQARWTSSQAVPDSVVVLREIRGYDE